MHRLRQLSNSMREKRVLTETMDRLAELVARRARLEAERDNAEEIRMPKELAELEPVRGVELIASETNLLQRSREVTKRERSGLESAIELASAEVESYRAEIARTTKRIEEQTAVFDQLKTLHDQQGNQSTARLRSDCRGRCGATRQADSGYWALAGHQRSGESPKGAVAARTFRQLPHRQGNRRSRAGNCPAQNSGRRNAPACLHARHAFGRAGLVKLSPTGSCGVPNPAN